jgi:hypothetical protein
MAVGETCPGCGHLRVGHYDLPTKLGCAYEGCPCELPPEPREFVWPAKAQRPKVPPRLATEDEIPKSAKTCIKYAMEFEWEILQAHYMRGCFPRSMDNCALIEDTEVFRLWAQREDLEVAASWIQGSFFLAYVRSISRKEAMQVNSRDLWSILKLELV